MSIKNIKKTSNLGSSAKKTQLYIVCHLENYLEIFSCNSHFTELGLRHCDKRQRDNVLCISITWHAKGSPLGVATYNDFCSNVFRIRIHFGSCNLIHKNDFKKFVLSLLTKVNDKSINWRQFTNCWHNFLEAWIQILSDRIRT